MVAASLVVDPVQLVLDQIFVAFGQGTGAMRVSNAAIQYATATYREPIARRMNVWVEQPWRVREYARLLGHLAAHFALEAGSTQIDTSHLVAAIRATNPRVETPPVSPPEIKPPASAPKMRPLPSGTGDDGDSEGECPFCPPGD